MHLPSESAVKTALRNDLPKGALQSQEGESDPTQAAMSQTEMILMSLRDDVRLMDYHYLSANTDKKLPKWQPLPRPGVDPEQKRIAPPASPAAINQMAHMGLFGD